MYSFMCRFAYTCLYFALLVVEFLSLFIFLLALFQLPFQQSHPLILISLPIIILPSFFELALFLILLLRNYLRFLIALV